MAVACFCLLAVPLCFPQVLFTTHSRPFGQAYGRAPMPGGGTLGEEPTQWVRTLGETCRKASESSEDEGIDGEFGGLAHDQR